MMSTTDKLILELRKNYREYAYLVYQHQVLAKRFVGNTQLTWKDIHHVHTEEQVKVS